MAALPNIDYVDFHLYPYQGNESGLQKYGQRLGFPNAVTGAGLRAQIQHVVRVAKANGKPVLSGEYGMNGSNTNTANPYPTYPRREHYRQLRRDFFEADGDIIVFWHYANANEAGGYNIYGPYAAPQLNGAGSPSFGNLNDDERPLKDLFLQRSRQLNGRRIPVDAINGYSR